MQTSDEDKALAFLQRAGHHTLSGNSYSFRMNSLDGTQTILNKKDSTLTQAHTTDHQVQKL